MKKLKTPCFRVMPASIKNVERGFKYTMMLYWDNCPECTSPIKHYASKAKAVKDLERAYQNYKKNKEMK